jgi:hypothetical protein
MDSSTESDSNELKVSAEELQRLHQLALGKISKEDVDK